MVDYIEQAIVIDNGSSLLKAGFAGEQAPKYICSSLVGKPKYERVVYGGVESDTFIGDSAQKYRGLLHLKYPMEHGRITNVEDMELLWNHIYSKDVLGVTNQEDHPVLLTEAVLNPRQNREIAAEIFFNSFAVKALYISMQPSLALYASGRTTGVVLDCGDGVTQAVPIYEGFAMKHAIMRTDVAGRDVTRHLQLLLRKEGHIFRSSAEFEVVRTIKEQACYVSSDINKEETRDMAGHAERDVYVLPDGNSFKIGSARYRAPEVLFNPMDIGEECEGVHEALFNAIQRSDLDLKRELFSHIVLSGGSTMISKFAERLFQELQKMTTDTKVKIKIFNPNERLYSTWLGGSILANLDTFRRMWVTKKEFEEEGMRVLHRRTFL